MVNFIHKEPNAHQIDYQLIHKLPTFIKIRNSVALISLKLLMLWAWLKNCFIMVKKYNRPKYKIIDVKIILSLLNFVVDIQILINSQTKWLISTKGHTINLNIQWWTIFIKYMIFTKH